MLKWTGTLGPGGSPVIGLGLEERNLENLRLDRPIHIKGRDLGIEFDILIYYGKDMNALMEMTKNSIGPDTILHDKRAK